MKVLLILLAAGTLAASPERDLEVREAIREAKAEVGYLQAELANTKAALSASNLATATVQAKADILTEQARVDAAAAVGWKAKAEEFKARAEKAEATRLKGWFIAGGLLALAGLYIAARLHPLTRAFVP